jgi:ATP-dependent RNA helicase DDX56/DBP9
MHIRSAVLNSELPLKSRLNIIEQFNVGNFDYLIATDESTDANNGKKKIKEIEDGEPDNDEDDQDQHPIQTKKKSKKRKKDSEYGVSRGLDFRGVSFVVNVDFPTSPDSYTHRIGRTARGGAKGVALSLVEIDSIAQLDMLAEVQESQPPLPEASTSTSNNGNLHSSTTRMEDNEGDSSSNDIPMQNNILTLQPTALDFDLKEIEGFRYRVEDVSRAVTKNAVKETKAAELRAEILNSERLQNHFAENPSELQLLRPDRQSTHISKVQDHLK